MKALRWIFVSMIPFLWGCERARLDAKMEELCKQDGGVKVYETVKLPPEMFDPQGDPFPGWQGRKLEERLGPDYLYRFTETVLKDGDPLKGEGRLSIFQTSITRRSDSKMLGVKILYGRSGGDFIAFAHPTSKLCPSPSDDNQLIKAVFLKGE